MIASRFASKVLLAFALTGLSARADVGDPQVASDHPWYPGELTCSTFQRLFRTQAERYQTVVGIVPNTDEHKALASWFWRNTHYYHAQDGRQDLWSVAFADEANWTREYWTGLFAFGFALCGATHSQWSAEMEELLGHATGRVAGVDGHSSFEVFLSGGPYGQGKWVLLDHDISTVIYDTAGKALLSIPEIKADLRLARRDYLSQKQHGWLVSGLHPEDAPGVYTQYTSAAYLPGYAGPPPLVHLRRGETLCRYLGPGLEDGKTFVFWGRNYNFGGIWGPERDLTWVNQPEKMFGSREGTPPHRGQARYGNALYSYTPDFASADYREGVVDEDDRHITFEFVTPYLIAATPPSAEIFSIYEKGCTNGLRLLGRARCRVAVSVDSGRTWQDCGIFRDGLDLTDLVKGQRQYRLRFGAGAQELAGTGLKMITVCQANAAILPHLRDGGSKVTFQASGQAVISAGPTLEQAKTHLVAGSFGTPEVTMRLATPHGERLSAVYAAAQMGSGNPPDSATRYFIDGSIDDGKTWQPIVKDWTIPRRGEEPADFCGQSFCWGSLQLKAKDASGALVRFRNSGGKAVLRAEVHLVYQTGGPDATKVTFDWTDHAGSHRESRIFNGDTARFWNLPTGQNVHTRWVEFETVPTREKH